MRVFIILATIALAHGAKLERTYLPPSHARASGGSGNFLQTPIAGSSGNTYQNNGFSNGLTQNGFSQSENGFSQNENGFSQNGNGLSQNGIDIPQPNSFSKNSELNVNGLNNFENIEARPERAQAAFERNAAILRQDNSNDGETYSYAYETENGIYAEESGVATNGVEAQGGYSYTGDDGQVYSIRYTADQNGFVPQGDHIPTSPPIPEEILKALEKNARDEAAGIFDDGSYNEAKYDDVDTINNNGQQNYQQTFNGFNGNNDDTVVTNAALARNYPTDADTPRGPTGPTGATGPNGPTVSLSASSGVEKAYLPPFASQSANGFGRRQQAFDSRTGYHY